MTESKESRSEFLDNLHNSLGIIDDLLCRKASEIRVDELPFITDPKLIYNVFPCTINSQTEHFNKYRDKYNSKRRKTEVLLLKIINKNKSLKDDYVANILYEYIAKEKMLSQNYYTVYHSCSRASFFYCQIMTIIYSLINKKNINTTLFRTKTEDWNGLCTSAEDFYKYIDYHLKNGNQQIKTVETNIPDINTVDDSNGLVDNSVDDLLDKLIDKPTSEPTLATESEVVNGVMKRDKIYYPPGVDHFLWYKKIALSVNLSLLGGLKHGENTMSYFLSEDTHTSDDAILNLLNQYIEYELTKNITNEKLLQSLKLLILKYQMAFKLLFESLYKNKTDKLFTSKSMLLQMFIKKDVIDKILCITSPCGNLLPITASEVMKDIQENKLFELESKINKIFTTPDQYEFKPECLKNNTLTRMRNSYLSKHVINLQGRFVCADIDTISAEGNVIIDHLDKTTFDDKYRIQMAYKVILSMILDCKEHGVQIFNQYHKNEQDACIMM